MFVFRVLNKDGRGLGHLVRCAHLAKCLISKGRHVAFILDFQYGYERDYLPTGAKVFSLYSNHNQCAVESSSEQSEAEDAALSVAIIKRIPDVDTVVVDHYALTAQWESTFTRAGYRVAVIDDTNQRQHQCDFLFDQKWDGQATKTRYAHLVDNSCQRFLGPEYALLSDVYGQVSQYKRCSNTLLLSLGGGGDLRILSAILEPLSKHSRFSELVIKLVIGPQASNVEPLKKQLAHFDNIRFIENETNLYQHYCEAALFVGALGTSLYELAACKTPAITFALASNQVNDTLALEQLGHYFHLDDVNSLEMDKLAQLIVTLMANQERVTSLIENASMLVDGLGVERVAAILLGEYVPPKTEPLSAPIAPLALLKNDLSVREVVDADINRYLLSRNQSNNSARMTIKAEIDKAQHYYWWFSNRRHSYAIVKNNATLNNCGNTKEENVVMYIWHQALLFDNDNFLIGGWFTVGRQVTFDIAIIALKWQLTHTAVMHPNHMWIAVINKDNKFVNLLNKYMGFSQSVVGSKAFSATLQAFPLATQSEFNFVKL